MLRIGILGDCQADAWAESIRIALPEDRVWAISLPDTANGDPWERAFALVGDLDHLLVVDSFRNQYEAREDVSRQSSVPPRYIPSVTFSAFHPDIMFAQIDGSTVHGGQGAAWLSRIALWSYLRGLPHEQAVGLYSREVYENVGYLDQYPISADACARQFDSLGFSAQQWLAECDRIGPFMHGSNHPTAAALCLLAQQLVREIASQSLPVRVSPEDAVRYMTDYQGNSVWPIYPPIARRYGFVGSYLFKHHGSFQGLGEHLRTSYARWESLGVSPDGTDLIPRHPDHFDDILEYHAGRLPTRVDNSIV